MLIAAAAVHTLQPFTLLLTAERALPDGVEEQLVGDGITKFSFRLLRHDFDHNYASVDSGEKHVFEITRSDGNTMHLHFHKTGKYDSLRVIPAQPQMPQPSHGHAGSKIFSRLGSSSEMGWCKSGSVQGRELHCHCTKRNEVYHCTHCTRFGN